MSNTLEWDYGLTALSEFVEGILMIAVDRFGVAGQSGAGLKPTQPLGILSRPADPTTDPLGTPINGAGALYFDVGGEGFVMPTTDPRWTALVPEIAKGSTILYSAKAWLYLNGTDNEVMLRQPIGSKSQVFAMSAKEGSEQIQIRHLKGGGFTCLPDGSVLINAETASNFVQVTNDGVVISGLLSLAGGAVMGDVVGAQPLAMFPANATAWTASASLVTALQTFAGAVVTAAVGALAPLNAPAAALQSAIAALGAPMTAATVPATAGTTKVAAS